MIYVLVYSLVPNTSTLNHKLYYREDTYTGASLCWMVTYYTQLLLNAYSKFQINFKVFGKKIFILRVSRWFSLVSINICVGSLFAFVSFVFIACMKSASNAALMLVAFTPHFQHWPCLLFTFSYISFMNLKCYLHQHLSRIISWYCSKVNTILTSKGLYTKVVFTLTHLYEGELLKHMHPLFLSLQFQIYSLSFTRPFLYMTIHAGWTNYTNYFFKIIPLVLN